MTLFIPEGQPRSPRSRWGAQGALLGSRPAGRRGRRPCARRGGARGPRIALVRRPFEV